MTKKIQFIKKIGIFEAFVALTCLVTKRLKMTKKIQFIKQIERCESCVTLTCLVTKRFKITEKDKNLLNRLKDASHFWH